MSATVWCVNESAEGAYSIVKRTESGREIPQGVTSGPLYDILVWLVDILEPGDLVKTPEGWSAFRLFWPTGGRQ